jgi:hypothetical protein
LDVHLREALNKTAKLSGALIKQSLSAARGQNRCCSDFPWQLEMPSDVFPKISPGKYIDIRIPGKIASGMALGFLHSSCRS